MHFYTAVTHFVEISHVHTNHNYAMLFTVILAIFVLIQVFVVIGTGNLICVTVAVTEATVGTEEERRSTVLLHQMTDDMVPVVPDAGMHWRTTVVMTVEGRGLAAVVVDGGDPAVVGRNVSGMTAVGVG